MTDTRDSFVNVKPVIVADTPDAHQVWLDIGVQHFTVGNYHETKDEAEWHARMLRNAISNIKGPSVDEMVNRFLGWKLPEDFYPDHGISFVRNEFHDRHGMPTGTNLFHAGQAKAMFQHCLAWLTALQSCAGDGEIEAIKAIDAARSCIGPRRPDRDPDMEDYDDQWLWDGLTKAIALISGNNADSARLKFVVENNWVGTATRCKHGIQDGDIESARIAIDNAQATEGK